VLRLYGAPQGRLAAAVALFAPQWRAEAQWKSRGAETLLAVHADTPTGLKKAAQSLRSSFGADVYGAGDTSLAAAAVQALEAHDRLLACGDAAAGALLESRLEKVPGAEKVYDFGTMSYADAKVGPQIEKRARAKLGGEGDKPDPVRLALARAQAARRIVGTELAVACAERESDHVLVLSTKKGCWLRTVPAADNPGLWLLDMVRRELVQSKAFTKEDLDTGGYKIITTIDKSKQDLMQSIGDTRLDDMPESLQIGGIALDPKTGEVLSVYAGSDYLSKQLNNADQAVFEPGSTMKPFALLGAAQSGVSFDTLFNGNSHQHFTGLDQEVNNALENNWGNINLYQATANSVNTVFMNVNEHLTPKRTAAIAHEAGIQGDIDENSMYNVLGINALTVWDLAQGHSTIANNGVKNTLHMVSKVLDSNNKDMYNAPSNGTKVFDANDCALVQKAMQGTTTYGTAAGTSSMLGRPVAGKSGTANDEMASSFVGYTPSMMNVWAIWNPDDKGNPQVVPAFSGYGVSSTGYPAHLFQEFMAQALQGTEAEQFPTAKDNGKIGGSDGTWGLGKGQSSGLSNNTNKQSTEDAQKQAEQDAQQKAAEEEAKKQQQAQEFAQQCLANPSYSTECPNYPGTTTGGDGNAGNNTGGDNGNNTGNDNGNSGGTGGNTGTNGVTQ